MKLPFEKKKLPMQQNATECVKRANMPCLLNATICNNFLELVHSVAYSRVEVNHLKPKFWMVLFSWKSQQNDRAKLNQAEKQKLYRDWKLLVNVLYNVPESAWTKYFYIKWNYRLKKINYQDGAPSTRIMSNKFLIGI